MPDPSHDAAAAAGCPVDHNARVAWLEKAAQAGESMQAPHPLPPNITSQPASSAPSSSSPSSSSPHLSIEREISTIPRAPLTSGETPSPSSSSVTSKTTSTSTSSSTSTQPLASPFSSSSSHGASSQLPNNEQETGTSKTGNWIYPSERMFFDAMRRKQYSPREADMSSIVPIHNAVNERAWKEIRAWESRFAWARTANSRCNGPRLASFSGDSSKPTPRARMNTLLGYQAPFDRHDWVIERCNPSDTVEYVIDFYQGRAAEGKAGLSFYLDVRPKLNSWEGCKMRLLSLLGW